MNPDPKDAIRAALAKLDFGISDSEGVHGAVYDAQDILRAALQDPSEGGDDATSH